MDRTIVLPVPENYDMDEITVIYRRRPAGSKAIRTLPPEEARKLLSKRTYRKSGRLKTTSKHIYRKWDDDYIIQNAGTVPWKRMAEHLGVEIKPLKKRVDYLKRKGKITHETKRAGDDALTALLELGYKKREAINALFNIPKDEPTEFRVKLALSQLAGVQFKNGEVIKEWSDDDDLYLAEHYRDPILKLLEHFNCPEREIRQRVSHLKDTGLIKEEPQNESLPAPSFMKRALDTMFGRSQEDTTPIEIGQKVWDFKYHEGEVTRLEEARQCGIVFFPSISEERKFNYDGIRRMIKAWKEKQDPPRKEGVANG